MKTELDKKIEQFDDLIQYYNKKVELKEKEMEIYKDLKAAEAYNRNRSLAAEYILLNRYLKKLRAYDNALREMILASANKDAAKVFDLNYTIKFIQNRVIDEQEM
jgi:hypothetical protein